MEQRKFGDVTLSAQGNVALVEFSRPPNNHFDFQLIADLASAFSAAEERLEFRAILLASEGKAFCAGANFTGKEGSFVGQRPDLYREGLRLFSCRLPVIAAIQGPAIGGGLGLSLVADFRVCAPEARFAGNFVKIGIHPGFALTHTLPRLIGHQKAALMLYTGRRLSGEQAVEIGLADLLAPLDRLREEATSFAAEIAENAPLAVQATRSTLRGDLLETLRRQQAIEREHQLRLMKTYDYKEGVMAVRERRPGRWIGA